MDGNSHTSRAACGHLACSRLTVEAIRKPLTTRNHIVHSFAEPISHSHPELTVAGASRVPHHRGTCGDRDATDCFCSALPAHIARPIPHRSSQFSRPAFFCRSFF